MKLVIDTSIIIAVLSNEEHKTRIIKETKGYDLIAPYSIYWEIGNALSAMLKQKRITIGDAIRAMDQYKKIAIRFVDIDLKKALEIASELKIYAYDAYIIACSLKYNTQLISLDKNLLQSAKKVKAKTLDILEV